MRKKGEKVEVLLGRNEMRLDEFFFGVCWGL